MKELSIEEKAKAYDEAIERAREWSETKNGYYMPKELCEEIFPELKESEDKQSKEWILEYLYDGLRKSDEQFKGQFKAAIAWLEKQSETFTKKDIDDAYVEGMAFAKNELEKQYEANYQIRKDIATFIFNYRGDIKDRAKWIDYLGIKVSFVEKQGEQKPNDKVEPKFKVGDWVVQGCNILKIRYVGDEYYCFETVGGYVDDMLVSEIDSLYHLWTIQDAEDGDVLACNEEILLFKSYSVQGHISVYCWYNVHTNDFCSKEVVDALMTTRNKICPATKEQRDTLFAKMKEAGYEWDAEKEELKKISQRMISAEAKEAMYDKPVDLEVFINELSKQFPDVSFAKLSRIVVRTAKWAKPTDEEMKELLRTEYEKGRADTIAEMQKSTWSEEDESILQGIWDEILANKHDAKEYEWETYDKFLNWLKSLKQRIKGE